MRAVLRLSHRCGAGTPAASANATCTSALPLAGSTSTRAILWRSFATNKGTDPNQVVRIQYEHLMQGKDLGKQIEQAFGADGLGIIVVDGVHTYPQKRKALLPLAQRFARLDSETKAQYEHPASLYSFGWSHGKETLEGGVPDLMKGSYYANPQYDRPTDEQHLIDAHPAYCQPNIWPKEHLPALEPAFKTLGRLMCSVGLLVAQQCDSYCEDVSANYPKQALTRMIYNSRTCKGRLLHYFPATMDMDFAEAKHRNWCGWHTDHGALTGLTCAMNLNTFLEPLTNPDPKSGLYIKNRHGEEVRVAIPQSSIAYQIGETSQILSGGLLRATPHSVKAIEPSPQTVGISRNTFAVFMQPQWDYPLDVPQGFSPDDAQVGQWRPGMDFSQFTEATLAQYYDQQ